MGQYFIELVANFFKQSQQNRHLHEPNIPAVVSIDINKIIKLYKSMLLITEAY